MKPASTTLADRLVQARTDRGLSQEEVARRVNMTQQSYSDLERGVSKRTTRVGSLARALFVDAYWLETGLGQTLQGVNDDPAAYAVTSDIERKLIHAALELSEEKKKALLMLLG